MGWDDCLIVDLILPHLALSISIEKSMRQFLIAKQILPLFSAIIALSTPSAVHAQATTEATAFNAQMIGSTTASRDNLYMGWYDYIIFFRAPQGRSWIIFPKTNRASNTYKLSNLTWRSSGQWTYINVTAGFRARNAANPKYNNRNPWEFGNELRVRYR